MRSGRRRSRRERFRPWLYVVLGIVALYVILGRSYGLIQVWRLRGERERARQAVEELRAGNRAREERRRALERDPAEIERVARESLGMIRPGESVYRTVPAPREETARGDTADPETP